MKTYYESCIHNCERNSDEYKKLQIKNLKVN